MSLQDRLYEIEQGFWLEGKEHFLTHVDDKCLLAFPQAGEMHGVHSREDVAATATSSNRWRDLSMNDRHLLSASDDFAIISYKAEVTRADGEPYAALVSSAYARRADGWKLLFHQHSPV
jgi:ketosteroid isomerase-like protein